MYVLETDRWFRMLSAVASQHSHPKTRVVACVVKGGRILGIGVNKYKGKHSWGRHAEIDALHKVRNAKGASIWVLRMKADDSIGLAKPCGKCLPEIRRKRIATIYYTTGINKECGQLKIV